MSYSDDRLNDVYDKNDGKCWHCGMQLAFTNYGQYGAREAWEVDHSIPICEGGTDHLNNLVPACIRCNREKGALHTRQYSY